MRTLITPLAFLPLTAHAALNDTGQTQCYNGSAMVACTATNTGDTAAYPGQDGRYGRDPAYAAGLFAKTGGGAAGFDFSPLDASGNPIALTGNPAVPASTPACERDNVTGLTWEVKTDDGGFRDKGWTYTWYSTDDSTNGGNAGGAGNTTSCSNTLSGQNCNTANYVAAVNSAVLCNHADWRLPREEELLSLAYIGASNPAIDSNYFPNTPASNFWSASSYVVGPDSAWYVDFNYGRALALPKAFDYAVRLVRGGQ